jgi:hypothetical protein
MIYILAKTTDWQEQRRSEKIADFSNHLDSGESVAKPTAYNTS